MRYLSKLAKRIKYLPVYIVLGTMLLVTGLALCAAWLVTGRDYVPVMGKAVEEFGNLTNNFTE